MPDASTMTIIDRRERRVWRSTTSSQVGQACTSLLVPLLIAVFTIVTTVLQMNLARQQREQDLHIAKENRNKDFDIASQTRVLQNQIEDSQQMNTVLGAYLKDMAEIMLFTNFTLLNPMIVTVIRAKTVTTLSQLDGKRKGHVVRFLYEAQMMTIKKAAVDLKSADLSGVDLTNYELIDASFAECNLLGAMFTESSLENVRFTKAHLDGATFDGSRISGSTFSEANLTYASFVGARFVEVDLQYATVTEADFTGISIMFSGCAYMKGNNTIFNGADIQIMDFHKSMLINASFVETSLLWVEMDGATLIESNFTSARLISVNFASSQLSRSIFDRCFINSVNFYQSQLQQSSWLNTNITVIDLSKANLRNASITDHQIRRAWKISNIILPDGTIGSDTNLLENGGAEDEDGRCTTDPWRINSIIAKRFEEQMGYIFSNCYFAGQSNTTQATMKQRVQIPSRYNEWISTGMAIIRITGYCNCNLNVSLYIRQFNGISNSSLANHTEKDFDALMQDMSIVLPAHIAVTEIELEIGFIPNRNCLYDSGSCDNLRLDIWYRNYIL